MKLAKSILGSIAAIGLTAGAAAYASEPSFMSGESEPLVVYEETYLIVPEYDQQAAWNDSSYSAYGIDDDMDGRVDRVLILEQSDSLG
jgi:hypothetical protein